MNKRLTKSTNNVVITGTPGGLAEYLGNRSNDHPCDLCLSIISDAGFPGSPLYVIMGDPHPFPFWTQKPLVDMDTTISTTKRTTKKQIVRAKKQIKSRMRTGVTLLSYFQRLIMNTLTFVALAVLLPNMVHVRSIMMALVASFVLSSFQTR